MVSGVRNCSCDSEVVGSTPRHFTFMLLEMITSTSSSPTLGLSPVSIQTNAMHARSCVRKSTQAK